MSLEKNFLTQHEYGGTYLHTGIMFLQTFAKNVRPVPLDVNLAANRVVDKFLERGKWVETRPKDNPTESDWLKEMETMAEATDSLTELFLLIDHEKVELLPEEADAKVVAEAARDIYHAEIMVLGDQITKERNSAEKQLDI